MTKPLLSLLAIGVIASSALAQPDLITGDITTPTLYGTSGGVSAYSFGDIICNIGTVGAVINAVNNQHPVTTENMYRYRIVNGAGRFEQIGQGWCFHHFCALQQSLCASCSPFCGAGCCAGLGNGCSSTTSTSQMGASSNLGPRWQVNPSTGVFTFPPASPGAGTLAGRLQVAQADLDPALNTAGQYFVEHINVAPDEAGIADSNNASYRRVLVGALGGSGYALTPSGSTAQQATALAAWQSIDPGLVTVCTTAGGGRICVASAVTDIGSGWWHYEYAVYNLNADRSVGSFAVPMGPTIALSQIGFTDVDYHSAGNPYTNEFWLGVRAGGQLTWSCTPHATNPNANAIRWGTMYSFRFDANAPPVTANGTLTFFKPGTPTTVSIPGIRVPQVPPPPCPGDANGDGNVDSADLSVLLGQFGTSVTPGTGADYNSDGVVNSADLSVLLSNFGTTCI